jgi:hypothetical protein
MKSTVCHETGDVRVENVPDSQIYNPTDAMVHDGAGYLIYKP